MVVHRSVHVERTRAAYVVVAQSRASHSPESARSCGKASIVLSVIAVVGGVVITIIFFVYQYVLVGVKIKGASDASVSNLFTVCILQGLGQKRRSIIYNYFSSKSILVSVFMQLF